MEIQLVAVRYPQDFAASGGMRPAPNAAHRSEFQQAEELRSVAVGGVKRLSVVASFAPRSVSSPLCLTMGRDGSQSNVLVPYKMPNGGPLLSRQHVSIELDMRSDTTITITCRDCSSMNGTFVHGKKVASGGAAPPIEVPLTSLERLEPLVVLDFGAGARIAEGQSLFEPVITLHVFVKLAMPQRDVPYSVFGRHVQRYDSPKILLPVANPVAEVVSDAVSILPLPKPPLQSDHVLKQRTEDVLSGILRDHGFGQSMSKTGGEVEPLPLEQAEPLAPDVVPSSLQQETLDESPPEPIPLVSSFVERVNAADRNASTYAFAPDERSQSAPVIILVKAKCQKHAVVPEPQELVEFPPPIAADCEDNGESFLLRRAKQGKETAVAAAPLPKKKGRMKGATSSQTVSAFIAELQAEREMKAVAQGRCLAKSLISGLEFAGCADVPGSDSEEDMLLGELLQPPGQPLDVVEMPQSCTEAAPDCPGHSSVVLPSHVSSGEMPAKELESSERSDSANVFLLPPESYVARNFSQAQEGFALQDAVFVAGAESQFVRPTLADPLFGDESPVDERAPARHFASLPSQKSIVLVPSQVFSSQLDITAAAPLCRKSFRDAHPQQPNKIVTFSESTRTSTVVSRKAARGKGKRCRMDAAIDAIIGDDAASDPSVGNKTEFKLDDKFCESQRESEMHGGDTARARLLNPSARGPGAIVPEQLWKILKPHQRSALQFMWTILARGDNDPFDLEDEKNKKRLRTEKGRRSFLLGSQGVAAADEKEGNAEPRGCILAHAMGLGKTLSVIALLFMLWRYTTQHPEAAPRCLQGGIKCILCVPKAVVFHWVRELNRWTEAAGEGEVLVYFLSGESRSDKSLLVSEWASQPAGGRCILLLTHAMLGHIMGDMEGGRRAKKRGAGKKAQEKRDAWSDDDDGEDAEDTELAARPAATRAMYAKCRDMIIAACNLVVVDEAHKIQSMGSKLSQALSEISASALRLALTGTPVTGNNFRTELRALLHFAMPSLWRQSDLSEKAVGNFSKAILHGRSIDVLLPELPRLIEHEVRVKLSPVQAGMFRDLVFTEEEKGIIPPRRILETVFRSMLIGNHCDLVADWVRSKTTDPAAPPPKAVQWALPSLGLPSALDDDPSASLEHSWKMSVLLAIVRAALHMREKIVIFSHSIKTLALIGRMLQFGDMVDGEDFGVLTGQLPAAARDDVTNAFNDPQSAMAILLLSFNSCSVGTSFTGANRVILYDSSWKGLAEAQAIFRVFRCGQMNDVVFVNKLVCDNVIESRMHQLAAAAEMTDTRAAVAASVSAHELLTHIGVVQSNRPSRQHAAENLLEADEALTTAATLCGHMIAGIATFSSFS